MENATASGGPPDVRFPVESPAIAFVECESFESYVTACITAARATADIDIPLIPIYTGKPPAALDCQNAVAQLTGLIRARSGNSSTVVLAAQASPAAICAYLLAGRTGARLLLLDDLTRYHAERAEEDQQTCTVALSETIDDGMLSEALWQMTRPCRDRRAWSDRNGHCFVTAGDLAGLSRYVARLIGAMWNEPGADGFHMIASDSGYTEYRTLLLGEDPCVRIQELPPDAVGTAIAGAEGVIALYGHGGEACAYAGGVTVLCGRRAHLLGLDGGGTLACRDDGVGCPRGPLPLPMATLRARHVMQASCSSIRLGDSTLTPAFSLLLSFVDGAGLSYVGTVMGGGRWECCVLYLAAMADGKTLGAALTLMSCFVEQAGLDQAVHVGLGLPDLRARAADPADPDELQSPVIGAGGESSVDFGARHLGMFLLSDPVLIDWAASGRLALALEGPTEAKWFCRLEEGLAGGGSDLHLRVFVFSFPAPLGRVRCAPFDRAERTRSLHDALSSLHRWIDYHRLIVGAQSEGVTMGLAAYNSYRDMLPTLIERLRFDGTAVRAMESVVASLEGTRALLRDLLLVELADLLSGPFWLSNKLRRDQGFVSTEPGRCPACGGKSFRRHMESLLSDERRSVNVCMRCGIVDDLRTGSGIVQVLVSCPATVERGRSLCVLVEVHGTAQLRECFVLAGISGPYSPKVDTQTLRADALDGVARVSFMFEIPRTMPLHEFRWKCVVADEGDIAFVSRNLFVVDAERA